MGPAFGYNRAMLFMFIEWVRGWLLPFPFWIGDLGDRGEYLARRHFHRRGYHLVSRNWRDGHGEIDAIMANHRRLIFLEVKTRSHQPDLRIGDTLGFKQKERLKKLAKKFLAAQPETFPWEFLLVLVTVKKSRRFSIQTARL